MPSAKDFGHNKENNLGQPPSKLQRMETTESIVEEYSDCEMRCAAPEYHPISPLTSGTSSERPGCSKNCSNFRSAPLSDGKIASDEECMETQDITNGIQENPNPVSLEDGNHANGCKDKKELGKEMTDAPDENKNNLWSDQMINESMVDVFVAIENFCNTKEIENEDRAENTGMTESTGMAENTGMPENTATAENTRMAEIAYCNETELKPMASVAVSIKISEQNSSEQGEEFADGDSKKEASELSTPQNFRSSLQNGEESKFLSDSRLTLIGLRMAQSSECPPSPPPQFMRTESKPAEATVQQSSIRHEYVSCDSTNPVNSIVPTNTFPQLLYGARHYTYSESVQEERTSHRSLSPVYSYEDPWASFFRTDEEDFIAMQNRGRHSHTGTIRYDGATGATHSQGGNGQPCQPSANWITDCCCCNCFRRNELPTTPTNVSDPFNTQMDIFGSNAREQAERINLCTLL